MAEQNLAKPISINPQKKSSSSKTTKLHLIVEDKYELIDILLDNLDNVYQGIAPLTITNQSKKTPRSFIYKINYNKNELQIKCKSSKSKLHIYDYDCTLGLLSLNNNFISDKNKEFFFNKILPTIIHDLE